MERRRINFKIGVTYETPSEKLERIPAMIQDIVSQQEMVTFDRAHFSDYGDFSLNFDIVYFVEAPDYMTYMNIQQFINLTLYKKFEEDGIEFAYPTQTVYEYKMPLPAK